MAASGRQADSEAKKITIDLVCEFSRTGDKKKKAKDVDTKHYLHILKNQKDGFQTHLDKELKDTIIDVVSIEQSLDNKAAMDLTIQISLRDVERFKIDTFTKCVINTLQSNGMLNFSVSVTEKGRKAEETKTFKVCIPKEVAIHLSAVGVLASNEKKFYMNHCKGTNFFVKNITVADDYNGTYKYFFETTERSYLVFSDVRREEESLNRKVTGVSIQRDIMDLTIVEKYGKLKTTASLSKCTCAADHIIDIMKNQINTSHHLEEIEEFLVRTNSSVGHIDSSELVREILRKLTGAHPLQRCYAVLFVFCCKNRICLQNAYPHSDWSLSQDSKKLIEAIRYVPDSLYPVLNENFDIVFEIYRNAYGKSVSLVDFVHSSWNVLSQDSIAAIINRNKNSFLQEHDIQKGKTLFEYICSGNIENECTSDIIQGLFENITGITYMSEVLSFLNQKLGDNAPLLSRLRQIACSSAVDAIKERSKWCRWSEIVNIISQIGHPIPTPILSYLHDMIFDALTMASGVGFNREDEFCEMIKVWIADKNIKILQSEHSQQAFLDGIKKTRMHLQLFEIFTDLRTRILLKDSDMKSHVNHWFQGCCGLIPKRYASKKDIVTLFHSIEFATSLTFFDSLEYFNEALAQTLTADCLEHYTEVVSDVDKMNDVVHDIYTIHLKRLLEKPPRDFIRTFIRRSTQNLCTSLQAECVGVVISTMGFKQDEDKNKTILSLLPHLSEWKLLAKAMGEFASVVKENETLCLVCECIRTLYDEMKKDQFDFQIIRHLKEKREELKSSIHIIVGEDILEVEKVLKGSFEIIPRVERMIDSTMKIINLVERSLENSQIQECLSAKVKILGKTKTDLREGKMTLEQYKSSDLPSLQRDCAILEPFIQKTVKGYNPKVFWAVNKKFLSDINFAERVEKSANDIIQMLNTTLTETYISFMKGIVKLSGYLVDVIPVFREMTLDDMKEEIAIYRRCSKTKVEETDLQACEMFTLENSISKIESIYNLRNVIWFDIEANTETKFDLMKAVAAFRVSECDETIGSFVKMVKSIEDNYIFFEDDFKRLLNVLSESSELLEFLEEIRDEDIRNLLDAAEGEHFDQYLPVVSHLIEVKELLIPLIDSRDPDEVLTCDKCILLLHESYKESKIKNAAAKCDECSKNYTNLRDFYKTFENRTEKTVDKLRNIKEESTAIFRLDSCSCEYWIACSYDTFGAKVTYSMADINDLRSRALLIQSRFEKSMDAVHGFYSTELFQTFLDIVDKTSNISNALIELRNLGHPLFLDVKEDLSTKHLSAKCNELFDHRKRWEKSLKECREDCEVVNFIKSDQLQTVYRYLLSGIAEDEALSVIDFINPDMRDRLHGSRIFVEDWNASNFMKDPSEVLASISMELEEYYKSIKPVYKATECLSRIHCDLQVQEKGIIFIRLEKDSPSVIPSILSLFHKVQERLPLANEIKLCNENTSFDEIQLMLRRWQMRKTHPSPLFCIAFTESLAVEIQYDLAKELRQCSFPKTSTLAIMYRGKETDTFPAIFKEYDVRVEPLSSRDLKELFRTIFPNVRVYRSLLPGQGKTESIFDHAASVDCGMKTVHISGPVDRNEIVHLLKQKNITDYDCLHLDVGIVDQPTEIDILIFELVVLGYVSSQDSCYSNRSYEIAIEIASTMNQVLFSELPVTSCFQIQDSVWNDFNNFKPLKANASATQVVCSYLHQLEKNELTTDLHFDDDDEIVVSDELCRYLLRKFFKPTDEPSYTQVNIFISVLALQLKKMSASSYFRYSNLKSMSEHAEDLKRQVIETMINFSNEFATRSVSSIRSSQADDLNSFGLHRDTENVVLNMVSRTREMIRWESSNHLVLVFHGDFQTLSALYRDVEQVPEDIKMLFLNQIGKELKNFMEMSDIDLLQVLIRLARTSNQWMEQEQMKELIRSYALTPDNLLKMVLILIRMQAHIPVVIMGETGCGKTSLIRKLSQICDVPLEIFAIHAGVSDQIIEKRVNMIDENARSDYHSPHWLFLDEINTSEHIGLLSSIVCHHKLQGRTLAPNIHVLSACNPYRLKNSQTRVKAGLKGKIREDKLSSLAYRVHPLPEAILDYVWDYGTLPHEEEKAYIERMIDDLDDFKDTKIVFVALITCSQQFVRDKEGSSCTVSLRDVERCKRLALWFYNDFLDILKEKPSENSKDHQLESIILALTVCYQCRFSENDIRRGYRDSLSAICTAFSVPFSSDKIRNVTKYVHEMILAQMDIPQGVARNTALQENVFLILICILNKIPLFLVGKPGCSKSLSMQLIRSNMRGPDSKSRLFKAYPRLYYTSFQGSESSTSEGILKVFERARRYKSEEKNVLSLVILDEVGLAEISRFNPLKVLHTLLEPDGNVPDVAVVGISNWALDAAKMNRAIHLSRPEMDREELLDTAESINRSIHSDTETSPKEDTLLAMVDAYLLYIENQPMTNFHGLRDFYSLVKFFCRDCSEVKLHGFDPLNLDNILWKGIMRNFGGMKEHTKIAFDVFQKKMGMNETVQTSVDDLIRENIKDVDSRHLMLILDGDSAIGQLSTILKAEEKEGTLILGSQFEEDQDDDYNYRTLNKIILCMEQPNILILKDLENIYGSLYDMLNQNYTIVQNKKHCRVALGPYSNPTCEVHDLFRCIVLVDVRDLEATDPPFLNRFEKQQFSLIDTLGNKDNKFVESLEQFLVDISFVADTFSQKDALAVFGDGFVASLISSMKQSNHDEDTSTFLFRTITEILWIMRPDAMMRIEDSKLHEKDNEGAHSLLNLYFKLPIHHGLGHYLNETCRHDENISFVTDRDIPIGLKDFFHRHFPTVGSMDTNKNGEIEVSEVDVEISDSSTVDCEEFFNWTAPFSESSDTFDNISTTSLISEDSLHKNEEDSLYSKIVSRQEGLFGANLIVFTYSTIYVDVRAALDNLPSRVLKLGEIKSEKHLSDQLDDYWVDKHHEFLVIQCDAKRDLQHILFAKTTIENSQKMLRDHVPTVKKHVCLLLHISRSIDASELFAKVNFLSGWPMAMLDSVEKQDVCLADLHGKTILEALQREENLIQRLIFREFPHALSMIRHSQVTTFGQNILSMIKNIPSSKVFVDVIADVIFKWIQGDIDTVDSTEWQRKAAQDKHLLFMSTTMIGSLLTYMSNLIRQPLSMALFKFEETDTLTSLLSIDNEEPMKKSFFLRLQKQEVFFDIHSVPKPTGPGCYVVTSKQLGLKTPFIRIYFDTFAKYREEVLEDFRKANVMTQFLSDQDNQSEIKDVLDSVINIYVPLFERDIYKIENDAYPQIFEDCLDDFCDYFSSEYPSRLSKDQRVDITKWVIKKSVDLHTECLASYIASLFISGWLYAGRIFAVLQLLDLTSDHGKSAISTLQTTFTTQSFTEDIENLLEDICHDILPKMSTLERISIQQWQETVYSCIASISSMGIRTPTIYILKLFSDLVANFYVPHNVPKEELYTLADAVSQKGLESRTVFQTLISYLRMKKGILTDESLQSVLCMFLSRTLESNPDSNEVMIYTFEEFEKGNIIQEDMLYFGPCLQVSLCDYEFDFEDEEIPLQTQLFYQIISNEQATLGDDQFLGLIDKIVVAGTFQSFTVLTMDLLEKFIYSKLLTVDSIMNISSHGDNILQKLVIAKVNLKEKRGNLQFICSLSFIKVFIRTFVEAILYRKGCSSFVITVLNEVFNDLSDLEHTPGLGSFETASAPKDGDTYGAFLFSFFYNTLYTADGIFTLYRFTDVLPNPTGLRRIGICSEMLVHQPMFYELFQAIDDETKKSRNFEDIDFFKSKLQKALQSNDQDGLLWTASVLQFRLFVKQFYHKTSEADREYSLSALQIAKDSDSKKIMKMVELLSMERHEFTRFMSCQNLNVIQTIFLCNWYCLNVCYSSNDSGFLGRLHVKYPTDIPTKEFQEHQNVRFLSHTCICGFRTVTENSDYKECIMCHVKTSIYNIDEEQIPICPSDQSDLFFDLMVHATKLCFSSDVPTDETTKQTSERAFLRIWDQLMSGLCTGATELFSILMIFTRLNKDMFTCSSTDFSKWKEKSRMSLNDILRHRFSFLHKSYENIIETYNLSNRSAYPKYLEHERSAILFATVGTASFESLRFEISLLEDETKYRFLRMVFGNLEHISLPKYMLGLLSWHKIIMTKCRYKIKKIECRFLSVGAFIQQQPRDHQTEMRKAFKAFKTAWTEIRRYSEILHRVKPGITHMGSISEESMLELCIIRDSESPLYQVMEALVLLQNVFIQNAMLIAANSEGYSPLSFMKKGNKTASVEIISVMDLRERHLIQFDSKMLESLLDFSQCGTTADTRRSVLYNFRAIEADLAHVLVHGKPHIDLKNSILFVEFKDDLYSQCVHLLKKLSERIPQKEITDDLVQSVREKSVNDPSTIPELLRLFGTIAILLDRGIECQPTTAVLTFLERYVGNILQTDYRSVLPSHEYELTISHVVSFYMLLEELNGEHFMESLDEEFKTRLTSSDNADLLENVCPHRPLTKLYNDALKLFLHRFLYIRDNNITGDQRLADHMADPILWRGKLELGKRKVILGTDEEYDFDDIMPQSLSVEHVYSIMDLLRTKLKEYEDRTAIPMKTLNIAQQRKKSRRHRIM